VAPERVSFPPVAWGRGLAKSGSREPYFAGGTNAELDTDHR
jgi:hypothetical protein